MDLCVAVAPDPFDPTALRLTGDAAGSPAVAKALLTVPVRKPEKAWFVRVHPDEAYRVTTSVIELKDEWGEIYLVTFHLRDELAAESTCGVRTLVTGTNRQGVTFLWPLRMAGPNGRPDGGPGPRWPRPTWPSTGGCGSRRIWP